MELEFTDPLCWRDNRGVWERAGGRGVSGAAVWRFARGSGGAFPVLQSNTSAGTRRRPRWRRAFPAGTTGAAARDAAGAPGLTGRGRDVTALPGDAALCSPGAQWAPGEVTSCRRRRLLIGRPWNGGEERGDRGGRWGGMRERPRDRDKHVPGDTARRFYPRPPAASILCLTVLAYRLGVPGAGGAGEALLMLSKFLYCFRKR